MTLFGWIGEAAAPPHYWDLRRLDMRFCPARSGCRLQCRHVLLCDARSLNSQERFALVEADRPAWRLILLGVDDPDERAELLIAGCGDVLSSGAQLGELHARTSRVSDMFAMLPRWRQCGKLVLDLFHRDARDAERWLGLHPREFSLLWRLADKPGERVTRRQLLREVWRIDHEPETNSVEVHVSRLRTKLAGAGCAGMVQTAPEGGYRLAEEARFMFPRDSGHVDGLDAYLRELGWAPELES